MPVTADTVLSMAEPLRNIIDAGWAEALEPVADRIAATWAEGLDVYVSFNNDQRGAAPRDAVGFAAAVSAQGRAVTRAGA